MKLAAPASEVDGLVGDSSWLLMSSEVVTSIQENLKLTIILIVNHGFGSIGALSESVGSGGFGTEARYRGEDGKLSGGHLPVDFVANAASLGAHTLPVQGIDELKSALAEAKARTVTTVIKIETDRNARVPSYESWWDVPVAEVSTLEPVRDARADYEGRRNTERTHL